MAFINTKTNPEPTYGMWLERYEALQKANGLPEKLAYARSKNLMLLRPFAKANYQEARIPFTEGFRSYTKKLYELRDKHLLTDNEGKCVMQPDGHGSLVPTVNLADPEYLKKLEALKAEYAEDVKERENDALAYDEHYDTAVPEGELPQFHMVQKKDAPDLTQDQIEAGYWFIEG